MLAERYPLNMKHVAAAGHSAGGHLALWLTAQHRVPLRGVVALAGVSDLHRAWELGLSRGVVAEFLGGTPEQAPERYREASPIEMLPLGVLQRLVHGSKDDVVPVEMSRSYVAAARAAGDNARLIELPAAGHFELIDPRAREWASVEGAIKEMLGE